MFPFTSLRLLLPAIVPSWRFFDAVTASPRLDYALLPTRDAEPAQWHAFRPRPPVLGLGTSFARLVWNAQSNENLFLTSLAERLVSSPNAETAAHSQRELLARIARHLSRHGASPDAFLQIRLRFISLGAQGDQITSDTLYHSAPTPIAELTSP